MPIYSTKDELEKWFNNSPEDIKQDFERTTGIDFFSIETLEDRLAGLEEYRIIKKKQFKRQREDDVRKEQQEFQVKLARAQAETIGDLLVNTFDRVAKLLIDYNADNLKRIEQILTSTEKKYLTWQETQGTQKLQLPVIPIYTNCIRYHPPSKEFPEGRPGPQHAVATWNEEGQYNWVCTVAYFSQYTGQKGFARLPFQILHAELLRQGSCPRPLSRSITRRIPALSWLFVKPDVCPLADGNIHEIEYKKY